MKVYKMKKNISKVILIPIMLSLLSIPAYAAKYSVVVESATPSIVSILNIAAKKEDMAKKSIGDIMVWTALQLLNKPYKVALLDKTTPEYLYVSLADTDCMLFVEEVLATSKLIKNGKLNLKNLETETIKLRYHGALSYCNRNHYFKDWAFINEKNGNIADAGLAFSGDLLPYNVNSMSSYLSTHKENLHSNNLMCIKSREDFINKNEKIGFIPLLKLDKYLPRIKSGDIIGIIRTPKGRADSVHHLGLAYVHDGVVSMIHASSQEHKVMVSPTLNGYLAKFKDSQGIVLFRPQ
jgi:hypothetical protein